MLTVITDRKESKAAFKLLKKKLSGGVKFTRTIGTRAGSEEHEIRWHRANNMWTLLTDGNDLDRFWCCYGLENPKDNNAPNITVEINPPHEWKNLRKAGMFARDNQGTVYLCHTGKIGGGRKGIGKNNFLERYRGKNFVEVNIRRKKPVSMINLGPINDRNLLNQITHFVREVARIKKEVSEVPSPSPRSDYFRPEFSGTKRSYSQSKIVVPNVKHGLVVDALANAAEKAGHQIRNDQPRDLFLVNRNDRMITLFEVKTSIETTDVYQAVGQLMLNGQAQQCNVRKVLVLPGKPKGKTKQALNSLKIEILCYEWHKNNPKFLSLRKFLYP